MAFSEFRADVESGAYPEEQHLVGVSDEVLNAFTSSLDNNS